MLLGTCFLARKAFARLARSIAWPFLSAFGVGRRVYLIIAHALLSLHEADSRALVQQGTITSTSQGSCRVQMGRTCVQLSRICGIRATKTLALRFFPGYLPSLSRRDVATIGRRRVLQFQKFRVSHMRRIRPPEERTRD